MGKKPKNIILDLGGVLLNIDYTKTIAGFVALGIQDFDKIFTQLQQVHLFDEFEKGNIDSQDFIAGLKMYLPIHVSDQQIIDAWNAMLLDFPQERLDFLLLLQSKYNLVLLSNTNRIHIASFEAQLREKMGIDTLKSYFKSVYYSCEMGMRKPDVEIFQAVCEKENFIPQETLFIDDSPQHVAGAKLLGMNALWLDVSQQNLIELITEMGLLVH